jgi:hypothetical protein
MLWSPWVITIDISWVDWAFKSSTCDVMYCRHSAAIYIMVVKFENTICPPPPQLSLHRRAALSSNSNRTRSVYDRQNPKTSLQYIVRCLWLITNCHRLLSISAQKLYKNLYVIDFFVSFYAFLCKILKCTNTHLKNVHYLVNFSL